MDEIQTIKIAIVDDNIVYIDSLIEHLSFYPEVEICGFATHYKQARNLLIEKAPDLVFLDVEMPCKNGFELLNEVRDKGCNFSVIFYTAYDKYMIQALRESAFDFLVKPVDPAELKIVIGRFKEQQATKLSSVSVPLFMGSSGVPEVIPLPTNIGIRFVEKNRILLFRSMRETILDKPIWEALLTDMDTIKLSTNTTAERIAQLLSKGRFVQINQSCIVNLAFLSIVEFKTRNCLLMPPFDNISLTVSRTHLSKLKEMYEVF